MKLSTRAVAVLLVLVMAVPMFVFSASAKNVTISADGIDVPRESGALVIYTSKTGASTGTNLWGYEVIIQDDKAVAFQNGNSKIPENGFVLSGHDEEEGGTRMGDWIKNNISIGDYVYYTPGGVITVSDVPVAANVFYTITTSVIGANMTREENSTVVYNISGKKTETNEWGHEVIITDGIVTSVGGNNNVVPAGANSFIVSAHGTGVTWLQENVQVGMRAEYDAGKKEVAFTYDEQSALISMEMKVKNLQAAYEAALARFDNIDVAVAKAELEALNSDYEATKAAYESDNDALKLVDACKAFDAKVAELEPKLLESRPVEYRGVWIRPVDTSVEQVDATVQKLYDNGINMICIETLYDSTMIMPMPEDSLFEVNPRFKHFDMLQAYVDSCHKRGMELHLWLPIFYVGHFGGANSALSVGSKKPEWLSISNNGKTHEDCEGFFMLDPGNAEVREFLLESYRYILENYEVDGFQLDYIRYWDTIPGQRDMGYNQGNLDAFKEKFGQTPKYDESAPYWGAWVNFRSDLITSFVGEIRSLIDEVAPNVLLGADVVPEATSAKSKNYQDFYKWLENGWLDILFPMSYGHGYEDAIADQVVKCGDKAFLAVGLGIFMDELTKEHMSYQAHYNATVNAAGSVFFEATAYLNKGTGEHLKKGVYATDAIAPNYDKVASAKALIDFAKDRINNVIIPAEAVSEDAAKAVISALDAFVGTVTADGYDQAEYDDAVTAIKDANMDSAAQTRVLNDLKSAIKPYLVASKSADADEDEDADATDESTVSVDESASADSDENGGISTTTVAVIIIVVVILLGAVAVVFIIKKK